MTPAPTGFCGRAGIESLSPLRDEDILILGGDDVARWMVEVLSPGIQPNRLRIGAKHIVGETLVLMGVIVTAGVLKWLRLTVVIEGPGADGALDCFDPSDDAAGRLRAESEEVS